MENKIEKKYCSFKYAGWIACFKGSDVARKLCDEEKCQMWSETRETCGLKREIK